MKKCGCVPTIKLREGPNNPPHKETRTYVDNVGRGGVGPDGEVERQDNEGENQLVHDPRPNPLRIAIVL